MTIEMIADHITVEDKLVADPAGVTQLQITGYLDDELMSDLTEVVFLWAKEMGVTIKHRDL